MTLSYILHEAGWATAAIEHDGRQREMRVSYLGDALLMMLERTILLLEGADSIRFGFADEPGGHEFVVTRGSTDSVHVQVFSYQRDGDDEIGNEVFACSSTTAEFCQQVFECCKRVLDEHGEEGYKERWYAHEFPTETFEHLSRMLFPPRRPALA